MAAWLFFLEDLSVYEAKRCEVRPTMSVYMSEYSTFDRQFHAPDSSHPKNPGVFVMVLVDDKDYSARFHHRGQVTTIPIAKKDGKDDAAIGEQVLAYMNEA